MGRSSTASSSSSLAPGFRFHPTDEELVLYYLKRKLINKRFRFDAISVVDVYRAEPWDLPSMSKLKTRDLEWYFFSVLDKKYGNKSRTNRATGRGYWKTTGKDRAVYHGSRVVGMKKTLVYHNGRAPRGERTNWVMHEYRLTDEEFFEHSGIPQDAFVLCRIFEKSGPGPKNGEKYGAPFIEEEWEDDEETYFPCEDVPEVDDLTSSDDGCLNIDELDKILDFDIASGNTPPPPQNFYYGESSKFVEAHSDVMNDDQEPIKETFEAANGLGARIKLDNIPEHPMNPALKPDGPEESSKFLEAHSDIMKDDQDPIKDSFEAANGLGARVKLDNIPEHPMNPALVPDGPEDVDSFDIDCFLDEAFFDATENSTYDEGLYLEGTESSRLIDSIRADASDGVSMVEEYLSLFDTDGGSIQITGLDSSQALGTENCIADQSSQSQKPLKESSIPNEHILKAYEGDGSSSPSKKSSKMENIKSVMSDPFIKKASHMLGNISAPSAFACEFPSKEAMLQLDSANAVHVAAGFIRVTNLATSGSETNWSATKSRDVKFVLSNGLSQGLGSASLIPFMDIISGRSGPSMPRGYWYCLFIWVLVISISFKVGTIIYAQ